MRLADFILANVEIILTEWEEFARSIWPAGEESSPLLLRDHSEQMLLAVARDMQSIQTDSQQRDKSKGQGDRGASSDEIDSASDTHAISRVASGFDLQALVAEYRALRPSVIHQWIRSVPEQGPDQIADIIRFNEAIDQLLAKSAMTYAQRMDQSREIFLGILCHDLRNPLQAVTMVANLLAESDGLDTRSRTLASQMASSVTAMNRMISDLLDFTGTRLGVKMTVSPSAIDLEPICREVLHEMEAIYPERNFSLECRGSLQGEWDAVRMRQMISNLVRNAVQHGSPATPVLLSAGTEGAEITLAVHNQGPTIPANAIRAIFEPLTRHHPPDSSTQPGSIGLGLYIAREVATAHGGSIDVESGQDQTVFTVKLPKGRLHREPRGTLAASSV